MPLPEGAVASLIGPVAFLLVLVLLAIPFEHTERGRRIADRAIRWIMRSRDG